MTDEELRTLVLRARSIAARVGPPHAMWDVIFDAECMLAGIEPIIDDRAHVEQVLQRFCDNGGYVGWDESTEDKP